MTSLLRCILIELIILGWTCNAHHDHESKNDDENKNDDESKNDHSESSEDSYDKSCNDIDSNSNTIFRSNLCGELVRNTDGNAYLTAKSQYAAISSPENVLPSMIVFAKCTQDIKITLSYATMCDYKIAIRSGGHQYSGLSSCNSQTQDCIQIDLSDFNTFKKIESKHRITSASIEVEVGTGILLGELNIALKHHDTFLPHGECDDIGLGGHISTGGQGVIHNQFGQVVDHVIGFDIILANGDEVSVSKPSNWQVNIEKSEDEFSGPHPLNDLLYLAVLGGSPGSYGVVTNVRFAVLNDEDYSDSSVFYVCDWEFDKEILRAMLNVMQEIYEVTDFNVINTDYTFYIRLRKGDPWGENIRFIGNFVSLSGNALNQTYFDRFIDAANEIHSISCMPQYIPPSESLNNALVPFIFDYPTYETRLQPSVLSLTVDIIPLFVDQMNEIYTNSLYEGIFIYSDVVFHGGNYYFADPNNERTLAVHTPNLQINTDVFWDENINQNGQQITSQWIQDSWHLWMDTATYANGLIDLRATGATFGNLNIDQVWQYYYAGGDQNVYNQLKQIKSTLDPQDLFSNQFTIPPL